MLALAKAGQEWPRLAAALGHSEWLADPRFADVRSAMKHRHELRALLAAAFGALTIEEADAALQAHDVTFSAVARIADVVNDPQLVANGLIVATESTDAGYAKTLASPFKLHDEAQRIPARAPAIGAHSREVLHELGYSTVEIEALVEQRMVGVPAAR